MRTQSEYWRKYLAGSSPCLFPPLTPKDKQDALIKKQTAAIALDRDSDIRRFCHQHGVAPLHLFQLAWAFVLSRYAATDDVVFGYRENATFDGALVLEEESIYRVRFPLESSVLGSLRLAGTRSPRHRAFQTGAIPATMRLAGYKGQRLFNTFLYLEPAAGSVTSLVDGSPSYPHQTDVDHQYDVVVKISVADDVTACSVVYSSSLLGEAQAQQLALTFSRVLDAILAHGEESTDELDLLAHASASAFTVDASRGCVCAHAHKALPERCVEQPSARAMAAWDGEARYQKLQGMSV